MLMRLLLREAVYAWRELRKTPDFTLTAVLTLAIGIGTTTAIFTLAYDVLLKPLPYPHPEQLMVMEEQVAEFRDIYPKLPMNANHFFNWQQNGQSAQSMAIMEEGLMPFGANGHPMNVDVVRATPGIFSVLMTEPALGRTFTSEETKPGHQRVVVLLDSLWRTQFLGDRSVLGKKITLDGFPYTVIGVMPQSFHLPVVQTLAGSDKSRSHPVQALIPMTLSQATLEEAMGDFNYFGLARLKPGVSVSQANAEINSLQHNISATLSGAEKGTLSAVLTPFQQILIGNSRTALLILLGAVAGLLLVGCLNITNLLLARTVGRRQQLAIAAALGARPSDLLRLGIREPALLAVIGGGLGILLAMIIVPFIQLYLPPELDFRGILHLDWAGGACALVLATMTALLVGAIPAWIISQTHPQEILHTEPRMSAESRDTRRLRRTLVATEAAISVALVLMTGLLIASLVQLLRINRGFKEAHVITAQINLPYNSYSKLSPRVSFYKDLLERLHGLPGVKSAGLTSVLPLTGDSWIDSIRTASDARPAMELPAEHFRWVSSDYFSALGLPLKAGRFLDAGDEGKRYAIVSELTARTLWPGVNPVGQEFHRAGFTEETSFIVIGVVGDARTISLAQPDPMMVYMPYWYRSENSCGLILRTEQDPAAIADAVRETVWKLNPEVSVPTVRSLDGIIGDSLANRRFEMNLLSLFAISALILAGLGVYGVVSYSVAQRKREIGIRLALGAGTIDIHRLVLKEGLIPVLIGVIAGIGVSFGFARSIESLLFRVSPYNPLIVITSTGVLIIVGALACFLPARRAAGIDPVDALRSE